MSVQKTEEQTTNKNGEDNGNLKKKMKSTSTYSTSWSCPLPIENRYLFKPANQETVIHANKVLINTTIGASLH